MDRKKQPHVIIIMIDCLRAQSVSCYGYSRPTTPNIDKIAAEGTRFLNAAAPSLWTVPSHASLFTGTYPFTHNAVNGHALLDDRLTTMAEALIQRGYRAIGMANNGWLSSATGLVRGFQEFEEKYRYSKGPGQYALRIYRKLLSIIKDVRYDGAYRTNRSVLRWLKRMQADDQPYFLFIHYNEAHSPYSAPDKFVRPFLDGIPLKEARNVNQDNTPWLTGAISMDDRDFEALTALYDGEIAYLDHQLSKVFQALRKTGLMDDTILIITADHGENLGDHGFIGHGNILYDTMLHLPLIVRYPGVFEPGGTIDTPVTLPDVFPTVLDLIDGWSPELEEQIEGASFFPERLDDRPYPFTVSQRRAHIPAMRKRYADYPDFDFMPYAVNARALRDQRWKYIQHEDGREELYDLQADPDEEQDLAAEQPETVARLRAQLAKFMQQFDDVEPFEEAEPELDDFLKEHLKALGYLE
jgi:arylsulfatase A-like enzyme